MANTGMCFFCMNCIYVHICVYLWHCWHMKSNVITVFSSERGSVFGRSVSFSHQRNATTWTNASLLPLRQGYSLHSYNPTKYPKLVHNQHTYFSMLLLFFYINKKTLCWKKQHHIFMLMSNEMSDDRWACVAKTRLYQKCTNAITNAQKNNIAMSRKNFSRTLSWIYLHRTHV